MSSRTPVTFKVNTQGNYCREGVPLINICHATPSPTVHSPSISLDRADDSSTSIANENDITITPENQGCSQVNGSAELTSSNDGSMTYLSMALATVQLSCARKSSKGALRPFIESGASFSCSSPCESEPMEQANDAETKDATNFDMESNERKRSRSPIPSDVRNDYTLPPEKFMRKGKNAPTTENGRSRAKITKSNVATSKVRSRRSYMARPNNQQEDLGSERREDRVARRSEIKVTPFKTGTFKEGIISDCPRLSADVKVFKAGARLYNCKIIQQGNRRIKLDTVMTPYITSDKRVAFRQLHSYGERMIRATRPTVCEPFSFDARDQELIRKKLAKANAGPVGAEYLHRAQPPSVLYRKPFIPAKSAKEQTLPQPPNLHTESRAKKREEFDKKIKDSEELRKILLQQREDAKNEMEIAELKKRPVFTARPAPEFSPFIVMSSNKPLTNPISPECLHHARKVNKVAPR